MAAENFGKRIQDFENRKTTRGGLSADRFGESLPFAEPYWYQGYHSPYYKPTHKAFREKVRTFIESEVKPNVDEWMDKSKHAHYPKSLMHELGLACFYPKEFGAILPEDCDIFHEMILWDEVARNGGSACLGQMSINSMALPPIIAHASNELKSLIVRDVIAGKKNIALAISEPSAGSDVAGIRTRATRSADGSHFIINGQKKWITGGNMADYFTMLTKTENGLTVFLVPRHSQGLKVRVMPTQFDTSQGTTFLTMDDVKVPASNMVGEEGMGFSYITNNFNHERWLIAVGACRSARMCYEESVKEALKRKTFGKRLIEHQMIRAKLAEMARQIESLYDSCERVAFQFKSGVKDIHMGGQCALLKVNASRVYDYCAREASQIFGGSSIVREGRGKLVEQLYRSVRASAIPGGSEEILLDFTMRQVMSKALSKGRKSKSKL